MSIDDRFGRLERARRDGVDEAPEETTGERFEQVEPVRAPEEGDPTVALAEERFTGALPPAPRTTGELELDDAPDPKSQPFVRCFRCGADSSVHARACVHCGAALDTASQRAFNERLWAGVQDENRKTAAVLDERQRRVLGEELAREVARSHERDDGGFTGWTTNAEPSQPALGWRLLSRLPAPVGWSIFGALVVVPALLMAVAPNKSVGWSIGLMWAMVDALLFLPRSVWRTRPRRPWF